ncbi:MAG TPA: hypothetical protein VMV83_12090 [Rectinemataceae bacterium]|nr:hypothetical protein [Rectinemataceae bacterium]
MRPPRLSIRLWPCLVLGLFPLAAAPSPPDSLSPALDLGLGPLLGLEEPLRGVRASVSLSFPGLPFVPSLRCDVAGDAKLATWLFEPSLAFGLGGDIALIVGLVQPLGEVDLSIESGRRLRLVPGQLPSLIGVEATLARRRLSKAASLALVASLDWKAWEIGAAESEDGGIGFASTDALQAFAAGFSAGLLFYLELGKSLQGAALVSSD